MRVRHWRALLAATVATAAVAAGVVALTTTANAAISDGTRARITAKSPDGDRYYLMPTGELRTIYWPTDLYTFVAVPCGRGKAVCYEIQSPIGDDVECLFYFVDHDPPKIQYGACGTDSLRHRWHVDSLDGGGVRLRPASHPNRCVVYDPEQLPDHLYTYIERCASRTESHMRFWLAKSVS
jgi:hypothetical protein